MDHETLTLRVYAEDQRLLAQMVLTREGDDWCGRDDCCDATGTIAFMRVADDAGTFVHNVPLADISLRIHTGVSRDSPTCPAGPHIFAGFELSMRLRLPT